MNQDELLKLLDLKQQDSATVPASELDITSAAPTAKPRSQNLTAFHTDRWSIRRGMDLLEESERLAKLKLDHFAIADFHTAAFDPDPQLQADCIDTQRYEFLKQLLETPEYQSLHAVTRLDDPSAAIAATAFAEEFAKTQDKKEETKSETDSIDREMETLRAVGRALTAARAEVTECQEAVAALVLLSPLYKTPVFCGVSKRD